VPQQDPSSEFEIQAAIVRWARTAAEIPPRISSRSCLSRLRLLYSVPNGGLRNRVVAAKLKATGTLAGVPDLCLPVARHGAIGLYIEVKTASGSVSPEQRAVMRDLANEGHCVAVARHPGDAIDLLIAYLDDNDSPGLDALCARAGVSRVLPGKEA
jgi:hypothetical protein